MSIEDNKALVRRAFEEVFNKGNVAAVDRLFAPNFVVHLDYPTNVPVPAEYQQSLEDLKQFISQFRTNFPDFHETVKLQVAEGNMVVTWTETHIFRIADGKIVEKWSNEDDLGRL
jgi:predicted SnoaL-like aldol condensation-catalyzing enzyme